MATYTNNLNLKKPSTGEYYDVVADLNDVKDKIDNHAGAVAGQINAVNAQLAQKANQFHKNYTVNLDTAHLPYLTSSRRAKKHTLKEIIIIGDSHLWGQGASGNDYNGGDTIFSYHSGRPYAGGFGLRLREYINKKFDYDDSMISFNDFYTNNFGTLPQAQHTELLFKNEYDKKDENIDLLSGNMTLETINPISPTDTNFYSANAKNLSTTYGETGSKQKFDKKVAYFYNQKKGFAFKNDSRFVTINPNANYTTDASLTTYKHNNSIYYGFNADKTTHIIHIAGKVRPDWLKVGIFLTIEGFGVVKVSQITYNAALFGYNIWLKNVDDSTLTDDISSYIYPGKQLYLSETANFKIQYKMKHHAQKMYLNLLKLPKGCKIDIYFSSQNNGAGDTRKENFAHEYTPLRSGYPKVYYSSGGNFPVAGSEVVIGTNKITIDTYGAAAIDMVYIIDWGTRQKGTINIEYAGENASATLDTIVSSTFFATRGFFFDGNIVKVNGFGSHTTSAMLGLSAAAGETTAHIDDLLKYSITCPHLLLIQAPIVNEYLRQTPIATFKANLDTIIQKFQSYRNPLYPTTLFTDVMFISTIGGKTQEFISDTQVIKYEDYFNGLRDYCTGKGYCLLDFRKYFKEQVSKGNLDHEMLYDDTLHPSGYTNEFIAKTLCETIDMVM